MNGHFGEGSYSGYGIATFANMSDNNNVVYDTEYDLFVYDSMGFNSMGYNSAGGINPSLNTVFQANISDHQIYQALSWANASMGLALSQADASALALKVNLPAGFSMVGGVMSAIGAIDNGIQFYETGDWQDGVQSFLGVAATVAAFTPGGQGVAFVLGGVLFIWELAE